MGGTQPKDSKNLAGEIGTHGMQSEIQRDGDRNSWECILRFREMEIGTHGMQSES